MGKKHKKHKSERRNEDEGDEKPSLKIVLKLGGEGVYDSDYAASSPASYAGEYTVENDKSHKKKKKKRRHNSDDHDHHTLKIRTKFRKENEEPPAIEVPSIELPDTVPEPAVAPLSPDNTSRSSQNTFSPVSVQPKSIERPQKKSIIVTEQMKKSLNKLLEHLLRQLERKDPHEIFAWPVSDIIAPGYFDVVEKPMDFSTMRKKISQNKYNDVNEFKDDFKLMVDNCCTYNRPDTIFHEIGKKLLSAGMKVMSKERLINMKRTLNFLHDLTSAECAHIMGLPAMQPDVGDAAAIEAVEQDLMVDGEAEPKERKEEALSEDCSSDHRAHPDAVSFTDADNEETVAPDVVEAARKVKERLAKRCPNSKMGFLRIDEVGKTTFNFLNPDPPDARVVDLGTLTGRLTSGLDALPEAKEDKRNKVTPLSYLGFGPFGSFSPAYDSRIANVTQQESDLLLSAYGGDTEYLFAKSLHNFVKDSDYDLIQMVDDLLDTLTHGAHKQALQGIEEKRKKEETNRAKQAAQEIGEFSQQVKMETEDLTATENTTGVELIQQKLDRAGELVVKLEKTQNDRLSEQQPPGQSNLKGPSEEEATIATELQSELSDLIQHAKPEEVSSVRGIRKAVGIELSQSDDHALGEIN